MIDIKLIRESPDTVLQAMEKRGEDPSLITEVIELDNAYRQLLKAAEILFEKLSHQVVSGGASTAFFLPR